jgi:Lrp/AsnC family transcriptional regulator, leucine-responsive regulatory protein
MSLNDISQAAGLSSSPCWRRIKKLEKAGVIEGYSAIINPEAAGVGLNLFVHVSMDLHAVKDFEAAIIEHPLIVECFAVTGDSDYLLHVMVKDIAASDKFLRKELVSMPGVKEFSTRFAISPIKKRRAIPLHEML